VSDVLRQDPLSGHLFVFRSKRGDRVKILYWNTHGWAPWYTRLEVGTFRFPTPAREEKTSLTISVADLAMLLDGVDLSSVTRRPRYRWRACAVAENSRTSRTPSKGERR
jgi:transposase